MGLKNTHKSLIPKIDTDNTFDKSHDFLAYNTTFRAEFRLALLVYQLIRSNLKLFNFGR